MSTYSLGNKYQIAGPDYEQETDEPCPTTVEDAEAEDFITGDVCTGHMIEYGYRGQRWVVCSECGYQLDLPSLEESTYDTDE